MPRRAGDGLTARAFLSPAVPTALVAVLGLAACQSSDPGAGCQLSQQVILPGTPLTLLPDARLDRVGAGFVLLGADVDRATVRWASLDPVTGQLGTEQALSAPAPAAGPWLAVTGAQAPGDTLLVARARVAANASDAEILVAAAPAGGGSAPAAGPVVAVIPGGFAGGASPVVAFAASRPGARATLAWLDPVAGAIKLLSLSASGLAVGTPIDVDKAPALACLAFGPGQKDLTLVHYKYADTTTRIPTMVITELLETGSVDGTLELTLDSHEAGCPLLAPTAAGYAVVFQDRVGGWLGVYQTQGNHLMWSPFATAVAFGGPDLQPPLVGLTPVGMDYAVLFARARSGELWRVAPGGARKGVLGFPSMQGTIGGISTQAAPEALTATYADYTSVDAGVGSAGQRFFLQAICPSAE
jgi:hypothetical protein